MSAIAQPAAAVSAVKVKKPSGWDQLRTLIPYVKRYKAMTGLGLVTNTLTGLVGALPQLVIGAITDCLTGSPQTLATLQGSARSILSPLFSFYAPLSRTALGKYCIILIAIMAVKGFFSFWSRWILIGVSREIEFDLRNDLFDRFLAMDPEFYVRNRTGDLMSRATNDLNAVRMVLGPGIMYSATTIVTMVVAIFFMFRLSPSLTLWVLLPVPVVAFAVRYFGETIHRLSEQIQAALGALSTRAQENLTGVRVIRAYAQEQPEIEAFDKANRDYVDQNIKLIATWSLFFPFLTALIGVTFVILLGKGGTDVIDHRFTVGTMWAFYWFLGQLVFPMIALGWVTNIFQRGAASMGRLNYILNSQAGIRDGLGSGADAAPARHTNVPKELTAGRASKIRGEIEFRDLTFTYPTSSGKAEGSRGGPVLHDINLEIPAGSTLAVVGPTGSGKSTLAALIARLWEAPADSLFIGWPLDSRLPAGGIERSDWIRSPGYIPIQRYAARKHRFRSDRYSRRRRSGGGGNREPVRRDSEFSTSIRNHGGRARNHAFRRAETTHVDRASDFAAAKDSDTGRRAFERRYRHRRAHPAPAAERDEPAHLDTHFASRFHGEERGSDYCAARRADHRARHAR